MNRGQQEAPAASTSRGYLVAVAVAIVGTVAAIAWAAAVVVPVMSEVEEFPRTDVPGETTVTIEEPGGRIVYFERRSWLVTTPLDPDVDVEVAGPGGSAVPVSPYEGTVTYRLFRHVGEAHATFDAPEPGEYTVTVDGEAADDATVAVGPGLVGTLVGGLAGPVSLWIVSLAVAVVVAVRTAMARSRDLR